MFEIAWEAEEKLCDIPKSLHQIYDKVASCQPSFSFSKLCCRCNLLPYKRKCSGKFFTKMKKNLTCSALGQRQLSWWVVAISLLCTVPLPMASVPVAISVDAVGHKLYPSGLIAIQNNNNKFRKKITIVSKYKVCAQAAHKSI